MVAPSAIKLTEADCRNVSWQLEEETPHYRRYVGRGTHPATGQPILVRKTEYLADEQLQDENAALRNDADGRRWSQGSGSEKGGNVPLVQVGRIPLNKFFAEVAPRLAVDNDQDFMRWWLQKPENQPFRTRRGNL